MSVLSSFLEVAVHQYLFVRRVYPATLFDRRRHFSMPVHMSRHPELNAYISRALAGVRQQLQEGSLGALAVVLVEEASGVPVERLVFNFLSFPDASSTHDRLEDTCRSFLLKIAMIEGALGRARHEGGGGLTFRVVAQSRGGDGEDGMGAGRGGMGGEDAGSWHRAQSSGAAGLVLRQPQMLPLKHSACDGLELQLVVEQATAEDGKDDVRGRGKGHGGRGGGGRVGGVDQ